MTLTIRSETPSDVAGIEAVVVAAFLNAPHADHTEHFIVNALRRAGQLSISLVADDGGDIVGHVAVSPVSISDGTVGWYGLGPIAVAPERQRQGIGTQLMEQALADLRSLGAGGCVLVGDPSYYRRFGFRREPALVLPELPPEYFQAIVFREPMPAGIVSYHDAFNARS